jgi:hypothetical protein
MKLAIIGDFADALSFQASQRVEHIRSLALAELCWLAVESDRSRPLPGRPLDAATGEIARQLALPGEVVPAVGSPVPNSRAATAAYAESLTDGVPDAMRRALFDALWVQRQRVDDPDVIRRIVFRVLNPNPVDDIVVRLRANQPIVPLGELEPLATTRRLGFIVSMGRGPLTVKGQDRIDLWRCMWQQRGGPALPLVLPEGGEARSGEEALRWLADLLMHRSRSTTEATPDAHPLAVMP